MNARSSYSLEQVAEDYLPSEWKRPVLWLQRRLRRGDFSGYKVGHQWRMTQADVDDMLIRLHNTPSSAGSAAACPADPADSIVIAGLSSRAVRLRDAS